MKTVATPFYPTPVFGPDAHVFEVRAGYPAADALGLASVMLGVAIESLRDAGEGLGQHPETSRIYTAIYSLEQAHALVDAVMPALPRSESGEPDTPSPLVLDLSEAEAALLAQVAAKEGRDLDATAAGLLSDAIRQHAGIGREGEA